MTSVSDFNIHPLTLSIGTKLNKKTVTKVNRSIHGTVNQIRSWKTNIKFFITSRFIRQFDNINKNRLKNIFYLTINDALVWSGIMS